MKIRTKKKWMFAVVLSSVCVGAFYTRYVVTHRTDPDLHWYAVGCTLVALLHLYVLGRIYDSIVAGYIKCEECGTVLKRDASRSTETYSVGWCPQCGWYYGFERKKP